MNSMTDRIRAVQVGAPDPELHNSPIVEETDEDYEIAARTLPDQPLCYFNGHGYRHDQFVCSGSELLRCVCGVWVLEGSCDPDNP
jgi:hypothetical protein